MSDCNANGCHSSKMSDCNANGCHSSIDEVGIVKDESLKKGMCIPIWTHVQVNWRE